MISSAIFNVETLQRTLDDLRRDVENMHKIIDKYAEENRKLQSEYYKDELVAELRADCLALEKERKRSFTITEAEQKAIDEWRHTHEQYNHGGSGTDGAIGGRYTYHFTPTSIGTVGKIQCSCGVEFTFSEV